MTGWRFAFSRRWAGYLALVIIFAVACVGLAEWQLARRDQALTEIHRIETNWSADPIPVAEALPDLDGFSESQKYVPVTMTGTYLIADQRLVRNRPSDDGPGFEVLTPLQMADGTVFIVDRGFLPTGQTAAGPDTVPDAPSGTVTVVARLKAGEGTIPGRKNLPGQVQTIDLPEMADIVGEPTYTGAYGLMASEDPAAETRPTAAEKPALDEGPHLSYAFQWFVFGLMAFIGLGYALRQEFRNVNSDDPEERARAAERDRRRSLKAKKDADIEDEILDRQH